MKYQARQGDIFFRAVEAPDLSKLTMKSDNILAYGEVTGHAHSVRSHKAGEYESYVDDNGDIYMFSHTGPIEIGHDEHDVVTVPTGQWICVTRQREYDPISAERERKVRD